MNTILQRRGYADEIRHLCALGMAGEDTIQGGVGNDTLIADDGDDWVNGDHGDRTGWIRDAAGKYVYIGTIDPTGNGFASNSPSDGSEYDDIISGGNDTIDAGAGNDTIEAGGGQDTLKGGDGIDTLSGGNDNDLLYGGNGNDFLMVMTPYSAKKVTILSLAAMVMIRYSAVVPPISVVARSIVSQVVVVSIALSSVKLAKFIMLVQIRSLLGRMITL